MTMRVAVDRHGSWPPSNYVYESGRRKFDIRPIGILQRFNPIH